MPPPPIQRRQGTRRNIVEPLSKHIARVRSKSRKAWEMMDDARAPERLIRDLAKRVAREAPGGLWKPNCRPRRNRDCQPSQAAARATALVGLHQCPQLIVSNVGR